MEAHDPTCSFSVYSISKYTDVLFKNGLPLPQVLEKHRATIEFEVNEDDVEGRWLKNGVEIQFSVEERFSYVAIRKVHRLTISETYRSDGGEYTFIAGRNRSTVHLQINSKSTAMD